MLPLERRWRSRSEDDTVVLEGGWQGLWRDVEKIISLKYWDPD